MPEIARLPWTHRGSMGLRQGRLLGQWAENQATAPLAFDTLVVGFAPFLTILLRCQEALSQREYHDLLVVMGHPSAPIARPCRCRSRFHPHHEGGLRRLSG